MRAQLISSLTKKCELLPSPKPPPSTFERRGARTPEQQRQQAISAFKPRTTGARANMSTPPDPKSRTKTKDAIRFFCALLIERLRARRCMLEACFQAAWAPSTKSARALLSDVSEAELLRLEAYFDNENRGRETVSDEKLRSILSEIELRVQVELAKKRR